MNASLPKRGLSSGRWRRTHEKKTREDTPWQLEAERPLVLNSSEHLLRPWEVSPPQRDGKETWTGNWHLELAWEGHPGSQALMGFCVRPRDLHRPVKRHLHLQAGIPAHLAHGTYAVRLPCVLSYWVTSNRHWAIGGWSAILESTMANWNQPLNQYSVMVKSCMHTENGFKSLLVT